MVAYKLAHKLLINFDCERNAANDGDLARAKRSFQIMRFLSASASSLLDPPAASQFARTNEIPS